MSLLDLLKLFGVFVALLAAIASYYPLIMIIRDHAQHKSIMFTFILFLSMISISLVLHMLLFDVFETVNEDLELFPDIKLLFINFINKPLWN